MRCPRKRMRRGARRRTEAGPPVIRAKGGRAVARDMAAAVERAQVPLDRRRIRFGLPLGRPGEAAASAPARVQRLARVRHAAVPSRIPTRRKSKNPFRAPGLLTASAVKGHFSSLGASLVGSSTHANRSTSGPLLERLDDARQPDSRAPSQARTRTAGLHRRSSADPDDCPCDLEELAGHGQTRHCMWLDRPRSTLVRCAPWSIGPT